MALTSSLMPSFRCSLWLFSCKCGKMTALNSARFCFAYGYWIMKLWRCHSFFGVLFFLFGFFFPQRNREEVSRQIYRACDGRFIGHVMRTCTCCRAVVTSSVPVPLRFGEDCFSLFLVCPSLLMQRREMQRNNELSLSCNWNVKAAVILF